MIQLLISVSIIALVFWYFVGHKDPNTEGPSTPTEYVNVLEQSRNTINGAANQENARIQEGLK
jgi:hypothetical protein